FLIMGLWMIVLGNVGLFTQSFSSSQAIFGLSQGIVFLAIGVVHSQIRSRGICHGGGLLPWRRIARYEWRDVSRLILDLNQTRRGQDRVQLRVPPVLVDQVDQLMRQYIPAKP